MQKFNILTLDWDYFIDATESERLTLFPDGGREKLGKDIENLIWVSKYVDSRLCKISVDKDAIRKIYELYSRITFHPAAIHIEESHEGCYDFVKTIYENVGFDGINLVNVDFHHDMFNHTDLDEELHCGNWVLKLFDEYKNKIDYTWIRRSDSTNINNKLKTWYNVQENEDIDKIFDYIWDAVFICRSDMWSPPHLDKEFISLFQIAEKNYNTYVEDGVFENRYNNEMKEQIKTQKTYIEDLMKHIDPYKSL